MVLFSSFSYPFFWSLSCLYSTHVERAIDVEDMDSIQIANVILSSHQIFRRGKKSISRWFLLIFTFPSMLKWKLLKAKIFFFFWIITEAGQFLFCCFHRAEWGHMSGKCHFEHRKSKGKHMKIRNEIVVECFFPRKISIVWCFYPISNTLLPHAYSPLSSLKLWAIVSWDYSQAPLYDSLKPKQFLLLELDSI